jgi:photosystem II stability/assembly factor-like uncharacterized protein
MRRNHLLILFLFASAALNAQVNSSTFGMMEARQMGPGTMSGRITAIEGPDRDEGRTLYVGTAGGGIWKTTNGGATFKPVFDKHCQSIGAIAIDQKNPKVVYAGTGESNMRNSVSIGDGIYKSTDAGENWVRIGLDSTEHISKVVIDPSNSNVIYVAAPGPLWSDSRHRGLYKSTDAGKTWEKILYISEKAGCADISLDPRQPNVVYATTWEFRRLPYLFNSGGPGSGIYKSLDGGKTWKSLEKGLPAKPFGRVALALAPSAPENMLAIVESEKTGLYISADGGENWKPQSASLNVVSRPFYFSTLVIDPKDPKRVYRPAYSFAYSSDGGYSFADAGNEGGWVHSDHHALWINPSNTNQLFLGTDGGVYMSLDRGASWTFFQNIPVGQFYHVDVDNRSPYRLYGGLQDNGSWMAPSSASGGVGVGDWKAVYGGDGFWVVPDPNDANIVYAESQGGDVNRIDTRTNKSVGIRPQPGKSDGKLRWNWNTPIAVGQADRSNLYVGAQYLYRSKDQGRSWTRISPDLTTNDRKKQEQENSGGLSADVTSAENHTTIFTIAESPLDGKTIWVGTDDGNLQYTTDGGANWTNVSKNVPACGIPAQTWVSSVEPSRFDRNTVYATFDNHMYGDHRTYLARSKDMGRSWEMISSAEFTGFAHKIREDRVNPDLLFLGTELGLFASIDRGANWFRMKNNIPWYVPVRDIQIHPSTHDLVLATHGRGVMIVDDITPMRTLNAQLLEKDIHFFPPKPMMLTTGAFGDGGFPSTGGYVAPNAPSLPSFQYYLKDRLSSGNVKVEILDAAGKVVNSLPASARKGVNKVTWNQRMSPPKTATGATKPDFGAFTAPQVLPGDYTVRLKAGNREFTHPLKLYHDSTSPFTLADRQLQYKTAMELYAQHESLARTVADVSGRQKDLKKQMDSVSDKRLKKDMQTYHDRLESLRAELIPTKQTSMFADEKKLREDITEVYSAVCNNEQAPTNLQLERVADLRRQVDDAAARSKALEKEFGERISAGLARQKRK